MNNESIDKWGWDFSFVDEKSISPAAVAFYEYARESVWVNVYAEAVADGKTADHLRKEFSLKYFEPNTENLPFDWVLLLGFLRRNPEMPYTCYHDLLKNSTELHGEPGDLEQSMLKILRTSKVAVRLAWPSEWESKPQLGFEDVEIEQNVEQCGVQPPEEDVTEQSLESLKAASLAAAIASRLDDRGGEIIPIRIQWKGFTDQELVEAFKRLVTQLRPYKAVEKRGRGKGDVTSMARLRALACHRISRIHGDHRNWPEPEKSAFKGVRLSKEKKVFNTSFNHYFPMDKPRFKTVKIN